MTRRTRFIAGISTLLALTFSFAEVVWASTCAPASMTGAGVEVEAASSEAPAGPHCLQHGPGHGEPAPDGEERPCPFSSPAGAQACAGVASIPARTAPPPAPWSRGASDVFTLDTRSDLLLESALFRPPRA